MIRENRRCAGSPIHRWKRSGIHRWKRSGGVSVREAGSDGDVVVMLIECAMHRANLVLNSWS